jgi:hypothetical protein
MKQIESVPIWNNGEIKSAENLDCLVTTDDLTSYATFYYRLLTIDMVELAAGNIMITGAEYDDYDSNVYAWNWIANKLGLVIVEETTTTTTENITTTSTTEPVV